MTTVSLDQLQVALDWVSGNMLDDEAFICRENGIIYWLSGEGGILDEEDELPGDIDDSEKYVPVPDRRDLDLGNRLAFDFAAQFLADQYDEVRDIFRRKGAYGRFKILLKQRELLEKWYVFSDERTPSALEIWCESEGFVVNGEFRQRPDWPDFASTSDMVLPMCAYDDNAAGKSPRTVSVYSLKDTRGLRWRGVVVDSR